MYRYYVVKQISMHTIAPLWPASVHAFTVLCRWKRLRARRTRAMSFRRAATIHPSSSSSQLFAASSPLPLLGRHADRALPSSAACAADQLPRRDADRDPNDCGARWRHAHALDGRSASQVYWQNATSCEQCARLLSWNVFGRRRQASSSSAVKPAPTQLRTDNQKMLNFMIAQKYIKQYQNWCCTGTCYRTSDFQSCTYRTCAPLDILYLSRNALPSHPPYLVVCWNSVVFYRPTVNAHLKYINTSKA